MKGFFIGLIVGGLSASAMAYAADLLPPKLTETARVMHEMFVQAGVKNQKTNKWLPIEVDSRGRVICSK